MRKGKRKRRRARHSLGEKGLGFRVTDIFSSLLHRRSCSTRHSIKSIHAGATPATPERLYGDTLNCTDTADWTRRERKMKKNVGIFVHGDILFYTRVKSFVYSEISSITPYSLQRDLHEYKDQYFSHRRHMRITDNPLSSRPSFRHTYIHVYSHVHTYTDSVHPCAHYEDIQIRTVQPANVHTPDRPTKFIRTSPEEFGDQLIEIEEFLRR